MRSNKKDEMKVVPKQNYVKISMIFIVTIIIVTFAFVAYKSHSSVVSKIPVIRGTIPEIEESDLYNYFTEHDSFLLYVGVADDANCRELEADLKDLLKNRGLLDSIYLNITSISNKSKFYNSFNESYSDNVKLNNYPAFVIISDRKVTDLVQRENGKLNIGDIERLLDEYQIKGELK